MGRDIDHFYAKYGVSQVREQSYKDEFQEMLEAIFAAEENIQLIVFRGHTPSFNDGDPCRHDSNIAVLTTDGLDDDAEILYYDLYDEHEESSEEDAVLVSQVSGVILHVSVASNVYESVSGVSKKVDSVIYGQNLADSIYDTNYIVRVSRTATGIKIEDERYDCGW